MRGFAAAPLVPLGPVEPPLSGGAAADPAAPLHRRAGSPVILRLAPAHVRRRRHGADRPRPPRQGPPPAQDRPAPGRAARARSARPASDRRTDPCARLCRCRRDHLPAAACPHRRARRTQSAVVARSVAGRAGGPKLTPPRTGVCRANIATGQGDTRSFNAFPLNDHFLRKFLWKFARGRSGTEYASCVESGCRVWRASRLSRLEPP